ncbi:MAG: phage portal protein [Bacteroidia bacterium]|nr:phage portal protein [Bacteroidia bacterium]
MEIQIIPTMKQHQAWEALKTKKEVFFGGGAGGGKSWWLCETRLINCYLYPGYKSFIGREELKRLMQSTFVTWNKVCKYHKIPSTDWKLNGQYNYIEFKNGSRIDLLDLKMQPSDPLYERFGSLEYTDGAIEEAGEVSFLAYDVLGSRIGRHLNKELNIRPTLAITGNPKKNWTYKEFYKKHKEGTLPDNVEFIQSLYSDNPHTAESYKDQLSGIKDKAIKQRLMYGNWEYDDDPSTLIEYDAIIDLYSNTIDESNEKYLAADIARYGHDKTVISVWKGLHCYKIEVLEKQGVDVVAERIKTLLEEEKIPYSHAIIDDDGVGGGVVDILRGVKGFVNNSMALQEREDGKKLEVIDGKLIETKPNYQNLKTQCYYKLAENINNHKIKISIEEKYKPLLEEELEQVKTKDADKEGKLKIISKDEVKEMIGRSPDFSDNLMMRMWFTIQPQINIQRPVYTYNINNYG